MCADSPSLFFLPDRINTKRCNQSNKTHFNIINTDLSINPGNYVTSKKEVIKNEILENNMKLWKLPI